MDVRGAKVNRTILMGIVIIVCPHTGRDVSTGIEIDEASFRKLPDVLVRSRCPQCGMQHAWWTREARLEAGGEARLAAGQDVKAAE
jgi:hypothetical protein